MGEIDILKSVDQYTVWGGDPRAGDHRVGGASNRSAPGRLPEPSDEMTGDAVREQAPPWGEPQVTACGLLEQL